MIFQYDGNKQGECETRVKDGKTWMPQPLPSIRSTQLQKMKEAMCHTAVITNFLLYWINNSLREEDTTWKKHENRIEEEISWGARAVVDEVRFDQFDALGLVQLPFKHEIVMVEVQLDSNRREKEHRNARRSEPSMSKAEVTFKSNNRRRSTNLELFIGVIDAELFEMILLENFEAKNVEHRDLQKR